MSARSAAPNTNRTKAKLTERSAVRLDCYNALGTPLLLISFRLEQFATKRELLAVTAAIGGVLAGGQLMPGAIGCAAIGRENRWHAVLGTSEILLIKG